MSASRTLPGGLVASIWRRMRRTRSSGRYTSSPSASHRIGAFGLRPCSRSAVGQSASRSMETVRRSHLGVTSASLASLSRRTSAWSSSASEWVSEQRLFALGLQRPHGGHPERRPRELLDAGLPGRGVRARRLGPWRQLGRRSVHYDAARLRSWSMKAAPCGSSHMATRSPFSSGVGPITVPPASRTLATATSSDGT